MKKSIIVGLHIGLWGCYFILLIIILGILSESDVGDDAIAYFFQFLFGFVIIPAFITFYLFYFILFPYYLKEKNNLKTAMYGELIALGAGIAGATFILSIFGEDTMISGSWFCLFAATIIMSIIGWINGIIALIIRGFITWFEEIKVKEKLRQKNHEMELALVKSQLDPHFLFNTINNIDVLILKDADQASDYLNKLSDIMRFMLFETKTDEIPLSKEIEYIDKYIELQKIRTSNANYASFSVTGSPDGKTIAPMVFIPFIENAFKHTNNKKIENAITIKIIIEKNTVRLDCVNKFDSKRGTKQESHGLGNELIQKRLNLIYPENHVLDVTNHNDLYSVSLIISTRLLTKDNN